MLPTSLATDAKLSHSRPVPRPPPCATITMHARLQCHDPLQSVLAAYACNSRDHRRHGVSFTSTCTPRTMIERRYSGYVDASATKHLHYWFVEAYNNPSTAPVVLWLNGGPGCSSLDGFLYEHGPFRINESDPTQLIPFEFTWANNTNMLYLESPVGVGFSYSDVGGSDYHCTDDTAAHDNLMAVQSFFAKFPELAKNDLYITGESCALCIQPSVHKPHNIHMR
jgi:carboxypeptidase C (cathepsin A)